MAYTSFFALTTRGLEFVSEQEIAAIRGVTTVETTYRRVAGQIEGSPVRLLSLRTVDDVYIALGMWMDVSSHRSILAAFTEQSRQLELQSAVEVIRGFRRISDPPIFSVTASFVGKRNYTADEIKQAAAAGIEDRYGWVYTADDRDADLNLRLFIDHELAYVGVRLAHHALHERPYKQAPIAGSLKPSVAAAMVMLAGLERGAKVLDPFCGGGTLLAEAQAMGIHVIGGDLSIDALTASQVNTPGTFLVCWDAGWLPLPDQSVDGVVSNFPWGRQVAVDDSLAALYRYGLAEIQRVLKPDSPLILLTTAPESVEGFLVEMQFEISLFGQKPTIMALRSE